MSSEPGLTLGRLVAAERNAAAAHQLAVGLAAKVDELIGALEKSNARLAQSEARLNSMNGMVAGLIGSGATERG